MSDVKAFTGFIAIDNSTHTSKKAAIDHSRTVKIKEALKSKFGSMTAMDDHGSQALDAFIYDNRDVIVAALNQEVLTRKKRTPNKPKAEGAKPKIEGAKAQAAPAAVAGAVSSAVAAPAVGVQSVENLDELLADLAL